MAFYRSIPWSPADDANLKAWAAKGVATGVMAVRLARSDVSVVNRLRRLDKQAQAETRQKQTRRCLCCTNPFPSDGPHNRLCGRCRTKEKTPFDF